MDEREPPEADPNALTRPMTIVTPMSAPSAAKRAEVFELAAPHARADGAVKCAAATVTLDDRRSRDS